MSALGSNPLWFATRAGGSVALILLTATVLLGVSGAGRYAPAPVGRFEIAAVHRDLSVLTLVFLALHVVTAVADAYVPLGWISAFVPFASPYRTLWVGLGAVGLDLLLAVAATSAVRLRLGRRRWRAAHWLAYGAWPAALFHGAGTGTDTRLGPQLVLYTLCAGCVAAAVGWRLFRAGPGRVAARVWAGLAVGGVLVLLYAFLSAGPLRPGWSHRAGAAAVAPPGAAAGGARRADL